jgi:alkane 1-monooxygenase
MSVEPSSPASSLPSPSPAAGPVERRPDPRPASPGSGSLERASWLLSAFYPLLPLTGVGAHAWSGHEIALGLPLLLSYGLMPLADWLLGEDDRPRPEAELAVRQHDRFYRWLTWIAVPMHLIALLGCAFWAGTQALSPGGLLLLAVVAGIGSGLGLNTGHELGHQRTRAEQWLARVVLALPFYGHFTVEHGQGHHRWVATPLDPASARMGESIYRFALREMPGGVRRAWQLEAERLARLGRGPWSPANAILPSWALSLTLHAALTLAFGWPMLLFLLVHDVVAWWQLTCANYVEHYGLLRERRPDGRWEPPQPHHAWNANHRASNRVLFNLQRHADHHANPGRRYQTLRDLPDLPRLPTGYFGMFPLACVPPLWFRVMDPRLLALPQVRGDLDRVNRDPRAARGRPDRPDGPRAPDRSSPRA